MVQLGALEAIRSGTTLVLEEGADIDSYARASPTPGCACCCASAPGTAPRRRSASPARSTSTRRSPSAASPASRRCTPLARQGATAASPSALAAWAPDMCSPDLLRRLRELQDELDVLATVHLNQIWGEVAAVQEQRGCCRPNTWPCGFLSRPADLPRTAAA